MNSLQAHEEAIRSQVCADCIYPSGSGICGAGHTDDCPLNTLLPRAIEAVKNGRNPSILEYFRGLIAGEENHNGTEKGPVSPEDAQWLKNSFPPIAAAVEEADGRLKRSAVRSGKPGE